MTGNALTLHLARGLRIPTLMHAPDWCYPCRGQPGDIAALNNLSLLVVLPSKDHAAALTHINLAITAAGPAAELLDTGPCYTWRTTTPLQPSGTSRKH